MFEIRSLVVFVSAALVLLIVPGPAVLYIIARSIRQGRMAGFVSALGIGLGAVAHVFFAALGLSALLMRSALAFSLVKYLGAAYLVYLGVRTLTGKSGTADLQNMQSMSYSQIFSQGFIVNLLNPKTALFFLAFLPQFVNPLRGSVELQVISLGAIFVVLAILSDSMYALLAGTAGQFLAANPRVRRTQRYFAGTVFIGLGITAAISGEGQME